jgi:hypothetical protein
MQYFIHSVHVSLPTNQYLGSVISVSTSFSPPISSHTSLIGFHLSSPRSNIFACSAIDSRSPVGFSFESGLILSRIFSWYSFTDLYVFWSQLRMRVRSEAPMSKAPLASSNGTQKDIENAQGKISYLSKSCGSSGHTNGLSSSTNIFLMLRGRNHRRGAGRMAPGLSCLSFCSWMKERTPRTRKP